MNETRTKLEAELKLQQIKEQMVKQAGDTMTALIRSDYERGAAYLDLSHNGHTFFVHPNVIDRFKLTSTEKTVT